LNTESFAIYQTYFREYLADANLRVIYAIEESEEEVMRQLGWTRAAYEKKLHDPDDCYLDVVRREEEPRVCGDYRRSWATSLE
jgi:ribosomal protein S18 acetylase RimI-like enzyme